MKKVLVLGACGMIGPFVTPGLEDDYDLTLSDIVPHPHGKPTIDVDVTDYEQVRDAARGMDAIMNFTVVRDDPVLSFHVSSLGAWHVMKAAAESTALRSSMGFFWTKRSMISSSWAALG